MPGLRVLVFGVFAAAAAAAGDASADPASTRDQFRTCTGRAFTPAPDASWRHRIATRFTTAAGAANHAGTDLLEPTGEDAILRGKFTYGVISKDLEDELVRVWIDDCDGWHRLGDVATDDDGRIALPVPAGVLTSPGVYEARFQVLGDQSQTSASVWILPAGTHLVLADIDGTLTTRNSQLYRQILDGSHVPAAVADATRLTAAHATDGQVVVYLTGRHYWLTGRSRAWLADLGFAAGPLVVAQSTADVIPTNRHIGEFKRRQVEALRARGYVIDAAYGNAGTDIHAYLGGGIDPDRQWIIGAEGGTRGTHLVPSGTWTERAAAVAAAPPVVQPFAR